MAHVITPISRLLVANRGEIARRINRTAQAMGISTVAIYADGDVNAPFVLEADTAIALNGKSTGETYLDVTKVLHAAKRSGADAIHPGYGFLSENQAFAQAVIDAGVKWLGPSPEVIGLMGDKLSAKRLMDEAGVPTLPGIEITADTDIVAAAAQIGYPVLVKASAGGGGRGMRVVASEAELMAAVEGAKREAGSSFGDDTVFLEKWLATSRHIEIQILGDSHGNLVHCYERECSIQRRHQKIIEEAPSPAVDDALRSRMGDAAIAAARKLGYASAGTVEFLLGDNDDFYFLEVNARLQVEHPVLGDERSALQRHRQRFGARANSRRRGRNAVFYPRRDFDQRSCHRGAPVRRKSGQGVLAITGSGLGLEASYRGRGALRLRRRGRQRDQHAV